MITDNERIAKFMDSQLKPMDRNASKDSIYVPGHTMGSDGKWFRDYSDIPFHKSWDWLMPVVERIEAIDGIRFVIEKNRVMVMNSQDEYFWNSGTTSETKLTTVFNAVTEFIKWFETRE